MKINKLLLLGALATLSFTACKNDKKAEEEAEKMEMEAKAEAEAKGRNRAPVCVTRSFAFRAIIS